MSSTIGVQNIAHTNGTNAMTISSGGVVVPSKQSHVLVIPQETSGYSSLASGTFLPFNHIAESLGTGSSDFSTTTYKYTAPCKGLYFISFKTVTNLPANNAFWALYINGSIFNQTFHSDDSRTGGGSLTKILQSGDVIGISPTGGGTSEYFHHQSSLPSSTNYTYATFTLLQEIV
jgi:hypothetical protein